MVCALGVSAMALQGQVAPGAGYGGIGDPAGAPGDPATSYALSGLDHVNLYSGSVNLTIPALSIGGRGTVGRNIIIPIQRQWTVTNAGGSFTPFSGQWPLISGNYTSGTISIETHSTNANGCQVGGQYYALGPITTYVVWRGADGSETVLTDTKYNGQPLDSNLTSCGQVATYSYGDRGTVFRSTDGTDLTYVSNADILDNGNAAAPNGTLLTRDGTKYTFSADSAVSKIEDRNGNLIQFGFSSTASGGIYTVTDPVGRTSSINFAEDPNSDLQDVLTYPGFNGASRQVKVNYALLQNTLAAGESLGSYHCLFPELNGASTTTNFNPYVVASVVLADGHAYTLQYNGYGEVARLTLPAGGVYVYKYAEANCNAGGGSGVITEQNNAGYRILRRLTERDEYADGANLSGKVVYAAASTGNADGNHAARPTTSVTVTFEDTGGNTLRQETHSFYGNPASTAADPSDPTKFADWWLGLEYQTAIGQGGAANRFIQNVYQQRPAANGEDTWYGDVQADGAPAHDVQLCQTMTSDEAGKTTGTVYGFDVFNNVTDTYEYDYGNAPAMGAACASAGTNYARHTSTQYLGAPYTNAGVNLLGLPQTTTVYGAGGVVAAKTQYGYDGDPIYNAAGVVGHDNANYGGNGPRGNVTNPAQCLNAPNCTQWANHITAYDIAGNVVASSDANGHTSNFSYADSRNTYAQVTSAKNALGQTATFGYDYGTGKLTAATDLNGVTTTWSYNDALERLTQVRRAAGGGGQVESQSNYSYPDANTVAAAQDQNTTGDGVLRSQTRYDGLGRIRETDVFESGSQYIATTQSYDALGRVAATTNPSRVTNGSGDGLGYTTSYWYDALGRTTKVTGPDGAAQTTTYNGPSRTVTDQAGKARASTMDGLGRLVTVQEDPQGAQYQTSYRYDALDNLTQVTQAGQTRSFQYDALSRQVSATNPESGTVSYVYL